MAPRGRVCASLWGSHGGAGRGGTGPARFLEQPRGVVAGLGKGFAAVRGAVRRGRCRL